MNDFKRNDRFGGKRAGGGFSRPQGQMHQATCAQCGKDCQVPFRPDGQRPIYCRDCFRGTETTEHQQAFQKRTPSYTKPQPVVSASPSVKQIPDPRIDDIQRAIAKMQLTVNQILLELAVHKAQTSAASATLPSRKKKPSKKK